MNVGLFWSCLGVLFFTVPLFASTATVEISVTGLEYRQTNTKIKPKEEDSSKVKRTVIDTAPKNLEFRVTMDQWVGYLIPEFEGGRLGLIGAGYKIIPEMEAGIVLTLQSDKTDKEETNTKEASNAYALYGRYWIALTEGLTLEILPSFGFSKYEYTREDDGGGKSENKQNGNNYAVALTLIHECATNVFYELGLGYRLSNLKNKTKSDSGTDAEFKTDQATLSFTPLAFRFRI